MMNILFYCEKDSSISLYKKSLNKIKECLLTYKNFNNYDINEIKNYDLIIVDIVTKKATTILEDILSNENTSIVLISSYPIKYLNFNEKIITEIEQILEKPISPKILIDLINNQLHVLKKKNYLKQREDALIEVIDKLPLNLGIYKSDGSLVYVNNNYINEKKELKVFDNLTFNQINVSHEKFEDIKFRLTNTKKFEIKESLNHNWYKNVFFKIDNTNYIGHIYENISTEIKNLENLNKAAMFFEKSNEGMLITDKNGYILNINESFSKITGYMKSEVLGKTPSVLNSGMHDKNFYQNLWENLIYNGKWQGEIWNKRKNGEIYPEWLSIAKIKDEKSDDINFIAIFNDITSIKEADKKLHFYANYDPLTNLLNRVQFDNMLSHIIQSSYRNNRKFALLFVDLDNFKEVNDTYGHLTGDILLKIVASRLRKTLRKEDIIARIGGDEFNIIVENINNESAAIDIAEKINEKVKEEIIIDGNSFFVSFSIGIALYPIHGADNGSLTKHADAAMYEVKKNGRNGVKLYQSHYTLNLIRKVNIQTDLKVAIANNELQMYYQPIYNTKTKGLEGAEALVRWFHKEKGFIPPSEFITIAEESDLIINLGKYIFQKILEDINKINNRFVNNNFKFAINISSKEFFEESFIDDVLNILNDFSIHTNQIELEITETHIMKNHDLAIKKLNILKENGIELAIDDFGTGYSSLNYLKSFPLSKLKIDQSFVFEILESEDDLGIVKAIVEIAKIFKLKVQAEGVETSKHKKILENMGCDFIQGYYYAKPMPLEEFISFIKNQEKSYED